jgi:DNA-binding beta-propeller fold protein YncE
VATSPDGSVVYVAGMSPGNATGADIVLAAYPSAGPSPNVPTWVRRYDGPSHATDSAHDVAVAPDGSTVVVTGVSTKGRNQYVTNAYDAETGVRRWVARYHHPSNDYDTAEAVVINPASTRAVVTGISRSAGSNEDYFTLSYNLDTGARIWGARFDTGSDFDDALDIVVNPAGTRVFVVGTTQGGNFNDYLTVSYRVGSGALVWSRRYNSSSGGSDDMASGIAVSPDGARVYVTGSSTNPTTPSASGTDYATLAYDAATGVPVWTAPVRYDGGRYLGDRAGGIAVSPDGTAVYVTGASYTETAAGTRDIVTVASAAADGAPLWTRSYDGVSSDDDGGVGVGVAPDGGEVYVVGFANYQSYLAIAYAADTGAPAWSRTQASYGRPVAMTVAGNDGGVIATGPGSLTGATNVFTVDWTV